MTTAFKYVGTREPLSHAVEGQIEQAIREKRLAPGDKLPTEMQLCEDFGVSRTVMREALGMLRARGLVSIQKGRGIFVKAVSASSVTNPMGLYLALNSKTDLALDVVHARQAIEPSIAAMAALHRTDEMVLALRENLRNLIALNDDYAGLAALDSEFHLLVAKASNNSIVPLVIEPIHELMPRIKLAVYDAIQGAKDAAVEYHEKIIEAIAAKDEKGAYYWMQQHLKKAENQIRQTILQRTRSEVQVD
jgi:GntR family transcriptional regulator, transcriptional repressor for pyruvate dehydrogenase complex